MGLQVKNISPSDIKGLLVHDPDDTWKKERISGMGDKNVCVTWDVMPLPEILESLSKIIKQNQTFELYYLKGNETAYKATVIDFSTKKEYNEKVSDLRWTSAHRFSDDFDKYDSGKNGVKVVFLASNFEEIKKENRRKRENFEIYNPTYSRQKQIMAYTKILTDNEIKNKNMIDQCINLLKSNSNLVLTGAPGTGKTYLAKQIASKMILGKEYDPKKMKEEDCEERKIFDEHCEFVQFHPSYDYTDFVEGLRPTKPDDNGNIGFERQDGVFKKFCAKALKELRIDVTDNFDEAWKNLMNAIAEKGQIKVPLLSGTRDMEIRRNEEGDGIIEYQEGKNIDSNSLFTFDKLYNIYKGGKGTPSGAHDTYRRAVIKEMKKEDYGLKEYNPGKIKKYDAEKDNPFIMIIDEINRGDISKIFGELFFSIDPGYRGKAGMVQTQYQNMIDKNGNDEFKDGFYVPENVYIIGTMNDIDRSVESMDFAMRRRFAWKEIKAEDTQNMLYDLGDDEKMKGEYKYKMDSKGIQDAKDRMIKLNKEIENEEIGLNSAYHIGAAYFMKLANYNGSTNEERFKKLWKNHLEGVLREYLRGDEDVDDKIGKLRKAFDKDDVSDNAGTGNGKQ